MDTAALLRFFEQNRALFEAAAANVLPQPSQRWLVDAVDVARTRLALRAAGTHRIDERKCHSPEPARTPDQEAADAFATLAVKIVLNENAELPVLSVMADRKVRPNTR